MPPNFWTPPQTGDAKLDRSFESLAQKLASLDAILESVALPRVAVSPKSIALTDEIFADYRGPAGGVVKLPPVASRGIGVGSVIVVQNSGAAALSITCTGRDTINGAASLELPAGEVAIVSGNGASLWKAIKPGGGHIIRNGVVTFDNRKYLNLSSDFVVSDDPANDETDVSINFPAAEAYPGLEGIWLPSTWYAAGLWQNDAQNSLAISGAGANTGFNYAYPQYFGRAGTINKFAVRHSSINDDHWRSLYAANTAGNAPGARLFSSSMVAPGTPSESEVTVNIHVDAGTILWFVVNLKRADLGYVNFTGARSLRPVLGTDFNGTSGGTYNYQVGYRVAQAYGQPPDPWTGTTKFLSSATAVPAQLFTFTPD